jgi:hypothetical protein
LILALIYAICAVMINSLLAGMLPIFSYAFDVLVGFFQWKYSSFFLSLIFLVIIFEISEKRYKTWRSNWLSFQIDQEIKTLNRWRFIYEIYSRIFSGIKFFYQEPTEALKHFFSQIKSGYYQVFEGVINYFKRKLIDDAKELYLLNFTLAGTPYLRHRFCEIM